MTRNNGPRIAQLNPFYDGEPDFRPAAVLPPAPVVAIPNVYGSTQAATYAPATYTDVRNIPLDDGRPMTAGMRSGPSGLGGTVIPHATLGGVPRGVRPHEMQDVQVNIDPHLEGARSTVRLGDINAEAVAAAEAQAREVSPDPYDMATLRYRSAAMMHNLANGGNVRQASANTDPQIDYGGGGMPRQQEMVGRPGLIQPTIGRAPQYAPPQPQQYVQQPQQQYVQQPQQQYVQQPQYAPPPPQPQYAPPRVSRPLQAFNQQPLPTAQVEQRQQRVIDLSHVPPPAERGPQPPQVRVVFELQNFGTHRARYHDVIVQNNVMVLVFRENGADDMYVPSSDENTPAMALMIEGTDVAYLVHTTGIHYTYDGVSFCVLTIERSGPVPVDQ